MRRKTCMALTAIFCIALFLPLQAYANSAEPPALIVILKNAPADVSVSIVSNGRAIEGREKKAAWETVFAFYNYDIRNYNYGSADLEEVTLRVTAVGETYDQPVDKEFLKGYNSVVTLDFPERTLIAGKLLSRSILLVTLRVSLTLLIEGLIFYLFGFRRKSSWISFFIINLLTQGILNIELNGATPFFSYLIFNLILMEFLVIAAEMAGFLIAVKEHKASRRAAYVLTANLASLILGGYLITALPV